MSIEAMSYVYKFSPFNGVAFTLHLAVADSVSDEHDMGFWMSPAKLAVKARTTRETASKFLWHAVQEGYLAVIENNRERQMPSRFEFLMPDVQQVWDPRSKDGNPTAPEPVMTDHKGVETRDLSSQARDDRSQARDLSSQARDVRSHRTQVSQEDPKGSQDLSPDGSSSSPDGDLDDAGFADLWATYPPRNGMKANKAEALRRWKKLTKKDRALAAQRVFEYRTWLEAQRGRYAVDAAVWLNPKPIAGKPNFRTDFAAEVAAADSTPARPQSSSDRLLRLPRPEQVPDEQLVSVDALAGLLPGRGSRTTTKVAS